MIKSRMKQMGYGELKDKKYTLLIRKSGRKRPILEI
jgi:hypothetical protein